MDLVLLRHGQTVANNSNIIQGQSDTALSELGMRQAEATAKGLEHEHFDAVYASDLQRAYITASIVAPYAEIIRDTRLREWNLGAWQGLNREQIIQKYPDEFNSFMGISATWNFQVPGGESRQNVFDRSKSFLNELIEHYGHTSLKILVVTHGGMLGVLLPAIMECGKAMRRPKTDNCGISRFNYSIEENGWKICTWNDTRYLDGMLAETGNF